MVGFGPLVVRADPIQIEQVLLNLIPMPWMPQLSAATAKDLLRFGLVIGTSIAGVSIEDNGLALRQRLRNVCSNHFKRPSRKAWDSVSR